MEMKLNYKSGTLQGRKDLEQLQALIIKELMALSWSMILLHKDLLETSLNFGLAKYFSFEIGRKICLGQCSDIHRRQ